MQVRLVRPGTWKGIWSYALGPAEDALCVKAMQLKNAKTGASPEADATCFMLIMSILTAVFLSLMFFEFLQHVFFIFLLFFFPSDVLWL